MTVGPSSLIFLPVTAETHPDPIILQFAVYLSYNKYYFNPRMMTDPNFQPEARLELGVPAALTIPISLFMFGWGARESVHW